MAINKSSPTYKDLFGPLSFAADDPGPTVYSTPAYLADFLQMVQDEFANPDFHERRPDIHDIPLDGSHAFGVIPYLDIVNEVLEARLGSDPYTTLRMATEAPFPMPF